MKKINDLLKFDLESDSRLVGRFISISNQFLSDFLKDEQAQGTVEYLLILSVVVVGASQIIKQIIQSIDKGVLRLGSDLEKDLKTGRTPVSVWEN